MARLIYTYTSLKELRSHKEYQTFSKYPHITANKYLHEGMEREYGNDITAIGDINSIISAFIPGWKGTGAEFARYTDLSRVVRDIRNVNPDEEKVCEAFVKNKKEVLRSIEQLTEMSLSANDVDPENIEERLFKAIWEKLEEENEAFGRFRMAMDRLANNASAFNEDLKKIIEEEEDDDKKDVYRQILKADYIVLHGFFYITPLQERFFEILEKSNKTLIFLCCVDKKMPQVAKVWTECLSVENGFPPFEEWTFDGNGDNNSAKYAALFEKGKSSYTHDLPKIKIYEYASEAAFLTDVKRINSDGYQLFSPDVKATEKIIKQVFPEKFGRKHLLSYPVGQYIYYLHSMWSKYNKRIELTFDGIVACFSSGWIQVGENNGRDYVSDLLELKEYLAGCSSAEEWEDRLSSLSYFKNTVLPLFEVGATGKDEREDKRHRMMGNPFLNFSCYGVKTERLNAIVELIHKLNETAKELFASANEINIADHIAKLEKILKEAPSGGSLFEEEKMIVEEILSELHSPKTKLHNCLPEDVTEAIMLVVSGGFNNEEGLEEAQTSDDRFVIPYLCVDGSPLGDSSKAHICLADESRLPRGANQYSWPITDRLMASLEKSSSDLIKRYIRDYKFVNGSTKLSNRYLLYVAMQNDDVEISWIAEENDKEIGPSPYISVLRDVYGITPTPIGVKCLTDDEIKAVTELQPLNVDIKKEDFVTKEELLDFAYCPYRYLYGYVLNDQPSYRSSFHYNFALSALIGSIAKVTGKSKSQVGAQVFYGFPYLRDVEKKQIIDFAAAAIEDIGTDFVGDASYPVSRLNIHMIPGFKLKKQLNEINQPDYSPKSVNIRIEQGKSYNDCMYCPFGDSCPHSADMEDEKQ